MNELNAYGRLLWRPRLALNLFGMVCIGVFACMSAAWLQSVGGASESARGLGRARLLLIALPAAVGGAAAFPIQELLYSPWAFCLPSLRRRLSIGLALFALAACAGIVLALSLADWLALPVPAALFMALLAFALGAVGFDGVVVPRRLPLAALAALVALLLLGDVLWSAFAAWPVVASAASLAGAVALLAATLSLDTAREKALTPSRALLPGFSGSARLEDWPAMPADRAHPAPPKLTPDDRHLWPWVWAALYEGNGWSLAFWLRRLALLAFVIALLIGLVAFQDGHSVAGSAREGLLFVHHALVQPGPAPALAAPNVPPYYSVAFAAMMVLLLLGSAGSSGLRPQALQPLSRRARAEIAWRGTLVLDVALALSVAVGLLIASELVIAFGSFEGRGAPLPNWARGTAVALFLAPLAHWLLRVGGDGMSGKSLGYGIRLLLLCVGLGVLAGWLGIQWGRHATELPAAAWGGLWLAGCAGTQLLHRQLLRGWFARRDLV